MSPNSKTALQNPRHRGARGFGLVEAITTIAVLGILAAILIPAFSGVTEKANNRRYQRMAQEFSMLASNAMAAGNTEISEASTVAEVLELLVTGVHGSGVFEETEFRIPNVSMADQTGAARHLVVEHGMLIYKPIETPSRAFRASRPASP